jgi:hypothetical protein
LNPLPSNYISQEQFDFLKGHLIHEAIGVAQEGLHTIKTKKKDVSVFKIDLSKDFDIVSWLFLILLLLHIVLNIQYVNWIMAGVTSASFALLINGAGTTIFKYGRGLKQGYPLFPYLFIMVMEGLSRALIEARRTQCAFHGISYGAQTTLTFTFC